MYVLLLRFQVGLYSNDGLETVDGSLSPNRPLSRRPRQTVPCLPKFLKKNVDIRIQVRYIIYCPLNKRFKQMR